MFSRAPKTKVAAAVVALALCTAGTAAAAATGRLPDPIQRRVARAASHVGVRVPHPADAPGTVRGDRDDADDESGVTTTTGASTSTTTTSIGTTTSSTTSTTITTTTPSTTAPSTMVTSATSADADDADDAGTPIGPDVTGPAKKGLCNAYLGSLAKGHPKNPNAVAFQNLLEAAAKAGESVEAFCADVTTSATTTAGPTSAATTPATNPAHASGTVSGGGNGNGKGHGKP